MAEYQTKDMTGAMFPNKRKTTDSQPDFTGNAVIGGKPYRISGWKNSSKSGTNYLSLRIQDDDGNYGPSSNSSNKPRASSDFDDFDEDIPF